MACNQCGLCNQQCPILQVVPGRKIYDVFDSKRFPGFDPWLCCSCYLCEIACPEHLSPRDAMFALRRQLVQEKSPVPNQVQSYLNTLEERGYIFPMDDWTNELREGLNLPRIDFDQVAGKFQKFIASYKKRAKAARSKETPNKCEPEEGETC